ncbi:putative ATP-grasp domain fused to redox center [Methanonatronarchaeum thermophilum]|uniref:Putative ATP-grasp domain fused to redox center n=1 Tax=Methanonatronarchaeum thermophilum TaxID=1927129 RepID=A0A1Y3GF85_9EURY|nr:ARMT1-like domain-containing protein [Methanonatronarchaeum thermophilum]OUJ18854.1 putative ATP-grasp domain fused to redox center [Methanonatronarchaeum thermophilum]
MKFELDCVPCLLNRVRYEIELSDVDDKAGFRAMSNAIDILEDEFGIEKPGHLISSEVHRTVYDSLGGGDIYRDKKDLSNDIAEKVICGLDGVLEGDLDKLVLASIVANSFDFGVMGHEAEFGVEERFKKEINEGELAVDDIDEIMEMVDSSDKIAYLLDNCGEALFDSLLIDELNDRSNCDIVLVVRGAPIFNDMTLDDVKEIGLDKKVSEVVELGERAVGINFRYLSEEAIDTLRDVDLIISKGMANYESLTEVEDNYDIAYLFKVKCEPVSRSIGYPVGSNIAKLSHKKQEK